MPKETYYFPHDYEPTSDPKIQALIGEHGALGYGIYWRIVEMLHSNSEHKLPHKDYIILAIAKQMQANVQQIEATIKYCILICELFTSDGDFFWSERVNRNISKRIKLSDIRSVAGKAGAIAKQTKANAKQNQAKKRKRNNNKENIKRKSASDFYHDQLSNESNKSLPHFRDYQKFVDFIFGRLDKIQNKPLENILRLPDQMTALQFEEIMNLYQTSTRKGKISDLLFDLENNPKYTKGRKSLYPILRKWLQTDFA
jgi:hypothetical protein